MLKYKYRTVLVTTKT